jgi:hypothetical protein
MYAKWRVQLLVEEYLTLIGKVCYVSGVDFYILKSISDVEGCPHEK